MRAPIIVEARKGTPINKSVRVNLVLTLLGSCGVDRMRSYSATMVKNMATHSMDNDFTALQHHRLPRVTTHHFMLTFVPAKIPCSDLCRSFSNSGTVTKPGASARWLMLGSALEKLLLTYC